jgi:hypothetical protein
MSNKPTALEADPKNYVVYGLDGEGWFPLNGSRLAFPEAKALLEAQRDGFHLLAC